MSISRRKLLRNGGLLSAAAAVSALMPSTLRAAAFTSNSTTSGLTQKVLDSLLNSAFKVVSFKGDEPTVYLTLVKVKSIASEPESAHACSGFILQFWGGSSEGIKQGLYTLTSQNNSALAPFKLLLVPAEKQSRAYHGVIYKMTK